MTQNTKLYGLTPLFNYVKEKNIKGITGRLKAEMDEKLPEAQTGPCEDHKLKWSFVTKHSHGSGEIASLSHIGCNLHVP